MFMRKAVVRVVATFGLVCLTSVAAVITECKGTWPDTWPKELEPFRENAKTFEMAAGTSETVHEIPFDSAEDFEKVWPKILTLMDSGSRIIVIKGPSTYLGIGSPMRAGVRILCPPGGVVEYPDGTRMQAGPPWTISIAPAKRETTACPSGKLDEKPRVKLSVSGFSPLDSPSIRLASGDLPEYVVEENRHWVPYTGQSDDSRFRARVDIVLVADGKIIDLNRIELPPNPPLEIKRLSK